MRNNKKGKSRGVILFFGVIIISSLILFFLKGLPKEISGRDLKLGVINKDGLELVSISEERKMINVLNIKGSNLIWWPKNLGEMEMFWLNFGFYPDFIEKDVDKEVWKSDWYLLQKMGINKFLSFKLNRGQMLVKEEEVNKSVKESKAILDEIMSRDFAENQVLNEDIKLSVFNTTQESGLADFFGDRLEWAGFSVLNTDNSSEKIDNCELRYGLGVDKSISIKMVNRILKCTEKFDGNLNENEAELYLGEKLSLMVK